MEKKRKVFMSFLGGGNYFPCTYTIDNYRYPQEQYIQVATLRYLTTVETWDATNAGYIFLTDGARRANWVDEGVVLRTGESKKGATGLERRLKEMGLPFPITPVFDMADGNSEEEIFAVFGRVYDCLEEGDELYLDITHGFRYLPMLMVVLANYAKFLKSVQVKSITYGNFEFTGAEKPIIQLLSLSVLQDWTHAAGQFVGSGDAQVLTQLGQDSMRPLLRDARGNDPNVTALNAYIRLLGQVIDEIRMCRGISIMEATSYRRMMEKRQMADASVIPPMSPILEKIQQSFDGFVGQESAENGLSAARWCYHHGLYQQAATILEESVVTTISSGKGWDWKKAEEREAVGKALYIVKNNTPEDQWRLGLPEAATDEEREGKRQVLRALTQDPLIAALADDYDQLSQLRNDINHAGIRQNPCSADRLRDNLGNLLNEIGGIVAKTGTDGTNSQ